MSYDLRISAVAIQIIYRFNGFPVAADGARKGAQGFRITSLLPKQQAVVIYN